MDHAGYIRINLKGREAQGRVEPGADYEALCAELAADFLSLRDLDTGMPIVDQVFKAKDLGAPGSPYFTLLPDLVITWGELSAIHCRGLVSETLGEIQVKGLGRLSSGRAGNHKERGWFIAAGNGIAPSSRADGHSIMDLVPTVFQWLGAEADSAFHGRAIAALVGA
jgi:predicted AlkP superfamily phosphohydrolase/phosphomutase